MRENTAKTSGSGGSTRQNRFYKIGFRLPIVMVGLAIVSSLVIGFLAYNSGQASLTEAQQGELKLLAESRRNLLDMRLTQIRADIKRIATGTAMQTAMTDLQTAYRNVGEDRAEVLEFYRPDGSTVEDRLAVNGDGNSTMYSWRHANVHGDFVTNYQNGGYADILVFNNDGEILYTVTKSAELFESVNNPEINKSGLGEVYRKAAEAEDGSVIMSSYAAYDLAGGEPSLFIATPVFLHGMAGASREGVVVIRLNVDFFDSVLADRNGLGETGQSYLVSDQGVVLSNKPLSAEPTALKETLSADVLKVLHDGNDNQKGLVDRFIQADGKFMVGAPLEASDKHAIVVAEASVDEALAGVYQLASSVFWSSIGVLVAIAIVGYFFARQISSPLGNLGRTIQKIEEGDLEIDVQEAARKDEIGDIGRAVLNFRDGLKRARELDAEQARTQQERIERGRYVDELTHKFDESVRQILGSVRDAGSTLQTTANSMASMSERTNAEAQTVSSASEQSLVNLQAVAGAAEELSATVGEIDREVRRSADISAQAAEMAVNAEGSVTGLMEAAQRIGEVVSIINDIADQTNLLALNATIEAARAGEAGKGFAVVAAEVKGLANQTGQATGEIGVQIQAVQSETEKAVMAIKEISQVIGTINEVATAIAGAVEEQAATATDISGNIQQVTAGSTEVTQAITKVSSIAGDTGTEAGNVLSASTHLAEQSDALRVLVENYLNDIRAA